MSAQATLIRTAIIELMQGSIGVVRTLPMGVFGYGVFDGQPVAAQQARSFDVRYRHQFDVVIGESRPHKSTPLSVKANYRNESRKVTLRISTTLSSSADMDARMRQREAAEQDCSDAIGCLAYPGNLLMTSGGEAAGIVSGMLAGAEDGSGFPRWEVQSEDWKRQLLVSRIQAIAIVNVSQAAAAAS